MPKNICVIGMGYIGLPTAAILANNGFSVHGVDTNSYVVDLLNNHESHIQEPGLKTLVRAAFNSGNLEADTEPANSEVYIIAVPTPLEDRSPDLTHIRSACKSISSYLNEGNLVILESTVPPNTTEEVVTPLLEESGIKAGNDFFLSHCPERVLPGRILKELTENDRIIGGVNPQSAEKTEKLYSQFVEGDIFLTDATTAELVKTLENTYRDVNIALANEVSNIARDLGIDVWEVINLANRHPRVDLLDPGPGVGGHCLPVDPWFIADECPDLSSLIKTSRKINESQPQAVVRRINRLVDKTKNPKVTILGVSYKGNVDDTRESPAIEVIEGLKENDYEVAINDPNVNQFQYELVGLERAFNDSHCCVLLADHDDFKYLSPKELGDLMKEKKLLDTRNFLVEEKWEKAGFYVDKLGTGG